MNVHPLYLWQPRIDVQRLAPAAQLGRDALRELWGLQGAGRERVVVEHRLVDDADGDPVVGAFDELDGVARSHVAGLDDPQVDAGAPGLRKALDHQAIAQVLGERGAGNPRLRHLEQRGANAEPIADHGVRAVDPGEGEVLAEGAGPELAPELGLPPGGVLGGVRVDGFVWAAVQARHLDVIPGDLVVGELAPPVHRPLVDAAPPRSAAPLPDDLALADVHRLHRAHARHATDGRHATRGQAAVGVGRGQAAWSVGLPGRGAVGRGVDRS